MSILYLILFFPLYFKIVYGQHVPLFSSAIITYNSLSISYAYKAKDILKERNQLTSYQNTSQTDGFGPTRDSLESSLTASSSISSSSGSVLTESSIFSITTTTPSSALGSAGTKNINPTSSTPSPNNDADSEVSAGPTETKDISSSNPAFLTSTSHSLSTPSPNQLNIVPNDNGGQQLNYISVLTSISISIAFSLIFL